MKKIKKLIGVIGLALLVVSSFGTPTAQAATGSKEIIVLGDSNTAQVMLDLSDRWSGKLGNTFTVHNEGVPGENSTTGKSRLQSVLNSYPNATDIVIMYGTNDAVMTAYNTPTVSRVTFESNMKYFVTEAREAGLNVVLMTTLPIEKNGYYERHDSTFYAGQGGAAAWHDKYNDITRNVSTSEHTVLVDNYQNIMNSLNGSTLESSGYLMADGTHLTATGSQIVYQNLFDVIRYGYRQSLSSGSSFVRDETMYIYSVFGDASKGVIDSYPTIGAPVTYELELLYNGSWTRYKTLTATTATDGYANQSVQLTSAYPLGTWRLKTTVTINGETVKFTKPFTIQ